MFKNILFIKLFLFVCFIIIIINANAQTGIFFQAIARDNYSNSAKDRKIYVQTNIIQSSPTGTIVLAEEHQTNTDGHGVFSIMVGNGIRVGGTVKGLSTIDWSKGPYFLNINIAITPVGGGAIWDYTKEWVNLGTTIFGTVPFSLFSANTSRMDEKLNSIDTAIMLSVYAKTTTVQALSKFIDTKLAIKDTAVMLAPYAKPYYKIDSSYFKIQLANKLDLSDTIKYTKQTYTDSALLKKMNLFDTSIYAKQVTVDAALLKKLNIADTIKYTKQTYTDSALLKKMNNFDTSIYAKQVTVDAALIKKLNIADTIKYTKLAYTDSALLTKMNSFDTTIYAKQVAIDAALLKKLNNVDTLKYTKLAYTDSALLTKMNSFDTTIYAKQVAIDAALLKKLNNVDTIKYTKLAYTDSALLTKMNVFDISTYAKQVTLDAGLLTKLSLTGNALTATTAINAGTASSATKLTTARNINGVAFDGTKDITITSTADAGTLTGTRLKSTVIGSSLTSLGTIASLTTGAITNSGKLIVGAYSATSTSAVLEASSTTQGFLPPRMTYYQRTQIASPIAGLTIWCSNCGPSGEMQVFNGGGWTNMIGGAATGIISLTIGQSYQGGKVAYILVSGDPGYDPNTPHGLIAATSDQSDQLIRIKWDKGEYTNTEATGTAIGTGFSNTNKIIASQGEPAISYAAGLARAYTGGGYTDWYLPSKDELEKVSYTREIIGGFVNYYYWSSSEFDLRKAWYQTFFSGRQYTTVKGEPAIVRAIRSF